MKYLRIIMLIISILSIIDGRRHKQINFGDGTTTSKSSSNTISSSTSTISSSGSSGSSSSSSSSISGSGSNINLNGIGGQTVVRRKCVPRGLSNLKGSRRRR
jgi:hypothetical protein